MLSIIRVKASIQIFYNNLNFSTMPKLSSKSSNQLIIVNKKARYNYFIEKTLEAGIVLEGWELKSIRVGKIQIQDSFVTIKNGTASTQGILINPLASASSHVQPTPSRSRKLLLHRKEIDQLQGATEKKGKTIVVVSLYWKKNLVKIEIGIGRGKKLYDKREDEKTKDWKIQQGRILKYNTR